VRPAARVVRQGKGTSCIRRAPSLPLPGELLAAARDGLLEQGALELLASKLTAQGASPRLPDGAQVN
jgi:hypothetical protein